MNQNIKKLIIVFFVISFIKIILNFFIKSPSAFSDSYFYMLSAKTFTFYLPPLYSFLISWVYLFNNSVLSFFLIKLTNSILTSLIIFPAYFLAKEYLKKENIAFYTAVIISLFATIALLFLFILAKKKKFYPAMPFLTIGLYLGMIFNFLLMRFGLI